MSAEAAIATWGLPALVLGGLVEGDTVGILGGAASHRGVLGFWQAVAALAAGATLGDQVWFHLARTGRDRAMVARIAARPAAARLMNLVATRPLMIAAAYRFVPGMRTVGPVVLGLSPMSGRLFLLVNLAAVAVWATLVTALGYAGGHLLHRLTGDLALHLHLGLLLAVCLATAAGWHLFHRR